MHTKIKTLEEQLLFKQKALFRMEALQKARRPQLALLQEIQSLKLALKKLKQEKVKAAKKRLPGL